MYPIFSLYFVPEGFCNCVIGVVSCWHGKQEKENEIACNPAEYEK